MSPAEVDWSILRRPLLLLVVSVVVSVVLAGAAYYYSTGAHRAHSAESRRLATARARYLTLDDEKRLIQDYYPQFEELTKQGRIGDEQRLDWIETLKQVRARLKLPKLEFEIGAQREYEPDFPIETGRFAVFASEMTLNIGLLHEEDLTRFFDALRREAAGLFSVASCRIRPAPGGLHTTDPTKANLDAQCRLRWLVVKLRQQEASVPARRSRRGA